MIDLQRAGSFACSANRLARLPAAFYAGLVAVLVAVGSLSLSPLWQAMCHLWATDPLRSIGAVFPLVACAGVLAAWRRLGWSMNGAFWALPLVGLSILLARAFAASSVVVGYNGHQLSLMNFGTVLFLYGSGAALLFGGPRLLRASIAPLCLLLFINPVPTVFNSMVDLPLQHVSASTARSFAHLIGLQPTGVQLRMMFAPDFGMFIAPGCNGVRGSITLGYLALIFGYARRLRPRALILTSLGALLLGYALNLFRLCVLVVYYRIGVSLPSIQKHGAGVDYAIGCTLFLFAALGLGLLIRSLEPGTVAGIQKAKQRPGVERSGSPLGGRRQQYLVAARALCFLALTFAFIVPELHSAAWPPALRPNEQAVLSSFPATVGPYRLTRTWAEHDSNGMIALAMAEYFTSPDTGDTARSFTFGLWVGSASHLVAGSKFIQGVIAQWTGSFDATTQQALPVHFVTSFYDDGASRQYDAESTCSLSGCAGHFISSMQKGFVFSAPGFSNLTFAPRGKSLPILLRREWLDSDSTPSAGLRTRFESDARLFMEQVDIQSLVVQHGSQF
ncbi:MAG: exosortase J [Terracidiphilus sp.]|nr:exosortase J [Terracidiphilus sp.]